MTLPGDLNNWPGRKTPLTAFKMDITMTEERLCVESRCGAVSLAQSGDQHDAAKPLHGFHGAGVLEIVESDVGGTYRAVYTVKFKEAVFVLHCFQKKSKRGIATPKEDIDIIHARLKIAEALVKELRNEKKAH
jgi:phage-related protein